MKFSMKCWRIIQVVHTIYDTVLLGTLIAATLNLATIATGESASPKVSSQPIYSLSKDQKLIGTLSAYGIPVYAMVGGQRLRGTYLTVVRNPSRSYEAGLRAKDVLLRINGKVTESPQDCDRIVREFSGQKAHLTFARKFGNNTLVLKESTTTWEIPDQSETSAPYTETMGPYGAVKAPRKPLSRGDLESYMVQLVNNDRTTNGESPVKTSSTLTKMAQAYADDISKRDFFAHQDPEGRGTHARAIMFGINGIVGENLAYVTGGSDLRDMVKRCEHNMMNEPKDDPTNHRANILNSKHKCVGIGVASYRGVGIVTVQEFSFDDLP